MSVPPSDPERVAPLIERRASPLQVWFGTFAGSALPMFVYSVFGLLLAFGIAGAGLVWWKGRR